MLGLVHWRSHWSRLKKTKTLIHVSMWLSHFSLSASYDFFSLFHIWLVLSLCILWFLFVLFYTWLVLSLSVSYDLCLPHFTPGLLCRPWGPVTVGLENARQGSSMWISWRTYSDSQCPRTSVGHSLQSPFRYMFHFNVHVLE